MWAVKVELEEVLAGELVEYIGGFLVVRVISVKEIPTWSWS